MLRLGSGRGLALVAVILLHAGLVAVVSLALHAGSDALGPVPASTLVMLDLPPPLQEAPRDLPASSSRPAARSTAITMPPLTPLAPEGPVDWDAAARRAVQDGALAPAPRALDRGRSTDAPAAAGSPSVATHHPGEQYVDSYGNRIVWVSNRCYVASSPAPMGLPDVTARSIPTSTVCRGDPGWADPQHLFKDLPAYQRYHAQEPPKH